MKKKIMGVFFALCTALLVIQGLLIIQIGSYGIYTNSKDAVRKEQALIIAGDDIWQIYDMYCSDGATPEVEDYCRSIYEDSNYIYEIYDTTGGRETCISSFGAVGEPEYEFILDDNPDFTLQYYTLKNLQTHDSLYYTYGFIDLAYVVRYYVIIGAVISLILAITLGILLMRQAVRRDEEGNVVLGFIDKLPLDIYILLMLFVLSITVLVEPGFYYGFQSYMYMLVYFGIYTLIAAPLIIQFLMSLRVRVKAGKWWHNTILYRLYHWMKEKVLICRAQLPLIWKGVILFLAITTIECFVTFVALDFGEEGILLFAMLLEKVIFFGVLWVILMNMRNLKEGAKQIAAGDLHYKIATDKMYWEFKQHGETLNQIGVGIQNAVEERMKSEHFKTELITNVSHDIKTPLTSIINYVDLLEKEQLDNPTAQEYLEVLDRQSARLKKLIEDLIEASKASTGALSVKKESCEIGVMLTQAAGEYEEKLKQNELKLIIRKPEEELTILADGRHLWRVFDNLLNNINKYAQPGTRVYLDMEHRDNTVSVIFRNTSKCELHVTGEELQERFVRGDSSRNTEGSGLGLSIARSLTELMQGTFALFVDGDLFKVVLAFPDMQHLDTVTEIQQ